MKKTNEKALTSEAIKELFNKLESYGLKPTVTNETSIVVISGTLNWTVEEKEEEILVKCDNYETTHFSKEACKYIIPLLIAQSLSTRLPINQRMNAIYKTITHTSEIFSYVKVIGINMLSFNIDEKPFVLLEETLDDNQRISITSLKTGARIEIKYEKPLDIILSCFHVAENIK